MTDWVAWHGAYDDRDSALSRRLAVVQGRLAEVVAAATEPVTLLSLCAGDGRDVVEVFARDPLQFKRAVLVELDPVLAARAGRAAAGMANVEVRSGDASDPAVWSDVVPVDVLLMCGVFGNVAPESVSDIVRRAAGLLRPGGHLIWTRGGGEPDRRSEVRRVVVEHGFDEVSFDGSPEPFGVGVGRLRTRLRHRSDAPLFEFTR